jgi:hypothetical protein
MTAAAYCPMNPIMNGFQGASGAASIPGRVVAESRPSTNTREKVICLCGKLLQSQSSRRMNEQNSNEAKSCRTLSGFRQGQQPLDI